MKSKYNNLFNNTIIFALGNIGSRLITFFLVPLYTNVLSKEQYGTADLVTMVANLCLPIVTLVIQDAVLRFGLSEKANHGSIFKNAALVFLLGTAFACAVTPLVSLYRPLREWRYYLLSMVVTNGASTILFAYAKAKERNKLYAIASIINTFILALTNILLLVLIPCGTKGYLIANIAAHSVTAVILAICTGAVRDMIFTKADRKLCKQMLAYSIPLIANNLSWWILNSSDHLMIEYFLSASDLGLYATAAKLPALLSIITSIFAQAWTISSIKEYEGEKDQSFYATIFRYFSLTLYMGAAFIMLILKPFMHVYVGVEFFDSWRYIPLLLFGMVFYSYSVFFGAVYGAAKKNVSVAMSTIIAAFINIVINLVLLRRIGTMGAVISTAVAYFAIGIYRMIDSRRFVAFQVDFPRLIVNSVILLVQTVLVTIDCQVYMVSVAGMLALLAVNLKDIKGLVISITSLLKRKLRKNQ